MSTPARRPGMWLAMPVRHGVSLRLLVTLAMLSTVTSILLGLGSSARADDDSGGTGNGEVSAVDGDGGGGGSGGSGEEGDGEGSGGAGGGDSSGGGAGGSGGGENPEHDPSDEGDGSGGTGGGDDSSGDRETPEYDPSDEGDGSGGGETPQDSGGDGEEEEADEEDEETAQEEFDRLVQEQQEADALNRGVISAFDVRDAAGSPVSAYRVYSETGDWDDWDLKVQDFFTKAGFTGIVWTVSFTCWLIAWALAFSLAALLFRPVLSIANSLHTNVLVQMGLPSLFLCIAMFVAGWNWMFRSRARGWGEGAAALTIAALAAGAFASPPSLLLNERAGIVGTVQQLAVEIAAMTVTPIGQTDAPLILEEEQALLEARARGEDISRTPSLPDSSAEVSRPITDALVEAFIAQPSQLLSYGQTFTGACAEDFRDMQVRQRVYERELEERLYPDDPISNWTEDQLRSIPGVGGFLGDWFQSSGERLMGEDNWFEMTVEDEWQDILDTGPVEEFEETCIDNPEDAKRASWDKVGGAFFAFLAALLAAAFVLVLVGAFLSAQFWLAVEAILAKLALVIGVLPGIGRAWLVARATEIARRLMLMIAAVGSLGVFTTVITELVNAPDDQIPGGITTRFIIIDIACVAGFVFRKRLTYVAASVARRTRERVNRSPFVGDSTSGTGPPGSGPMGGGFGRGGHRLRQMAWLAVGMSTGGGSTVTRALARAPVRAAAGAVVNAGRTAGVMARGAQIGAQGAAGAGRAVFTQAGRAGLRNGMRQARNQAGLGLPAGVPANAAQLRARIAGMRAAAARRAGSPARPPGRMWAPAGARPAARIGGPAGAGPRGRRPGPPPARGPRPAGVPPVRGGAGAPAAPALNPAVAAMRRRAARAQARRQAAAPRRRQSPGATPPGTPAPTPPVQPGPPVTPRSPGRRGGGGGGASGGAP